MKKSMVLTIGCLILLVGVLVCLYLKPRPLIVRIDEYVKNLETARSEADNARLEWASHSEERKKLEIEQLKGLDVPDLSKKAVSILVRHENPEYIVNKAIDATRKELDAWVVTPPWGKSTAPENNKFWDMVYRETRGADHDWWVEQNKVFGQYRLVGSPNQRVYFSINNEQKLRTVLVYIVMLGDVKPFYRVVDGDDCTPENYCAILPLSEARKMFPESMKIVAGIYAKHPSNQYALVPVADYYASLAMDKAIECVVLLGRMGAKSVHVLRTDGEKLDVGVGMGVSVNGINAAVNAALVNGMKSKMDMKVVFSGDSNVDIPKTLLANSTWHKSDSSLNGILEARLSGNKLKEYSITEEEQYDYNFDFKAAASVLKIAEADLRARFEKMKNTKRTFHVIF